MKQQWRILLVTMAAALSLLGVTVWAADSTDATQPPAAQAETQEEQAAPDGSETGESQAAQEETTEETAQEPMEEWGQAEEEYIPDPVGSITFENLERRLREHNLALLTLEENIQAIEVIDYDVMYDTLRQNMNSIASAQWTMIMYGMGETPEAKALQQSYDALRETFDAIKNGELQEDNEDVLWQLRSAQNQIVMAGESLYIAIVEMEQNQQALERSLAALDRSLEELELRYELGQVSSQTLKQTQATRTSLLSSKQTLESNIKNYKMQLELMSGGELNGTIQLGELPQVTDQQLTEMNLEEDLAAAKAASYDLYVAQQEREEAQDNARGQAGLYGYREDRYEVQSANHQWQAAQYNYDATIQNFEIAFRTLYVQTKDFKQVLDAAKTALAVAQDNYAVAQLKYEQGNLSQNDLLEAEDKVKEAQEAVDGAENDLFSSYHTYRWAVEYGILNG